jgi:hypothetical protein
MKFTKILSRVFASISSLKSNKALVKFYSPVSIFGQEISINSFHQVLKPSCHVRLFRRRLRLNDLKKNITSY